MIIITNKTSSVVLDVCIRQLNIIHKYKIDFQGLKPTYHKFFTKIYTHITCLLT